MKNNLIHNKQLIDELEYKLSHLYLEPLNFTVSNKFKLTDVMNDVLSLKKQYMSSYLDLVKKHTTQLEKENK